MNCPPSATSKALGLLVTRQNSILPLRESGIRRKRDPEFEPISNHPLEHGAFLRPQRRNTGLGTESDDGAVPALLATGFRVDLPTRTFCYGCAGFDPGFFCD